MPRRPVLLGVILAGLLGVGLTLQVEAQGAFSAQITRALRAYGFSAPGVLVVSSCTGCGAGTVYTGTANQVIVTGSVLSTPQSIGTASTPQFAALGLGTTAPLTGINLQSGFINYNTSTNAGIGSNAIGMGFDLRQGVGLRLAVSHTIGFTANANMTVAIDAGLARSAAGVVSVTDGASGTGAIKVSAVQGAGTGTTVANVGANSCGTTAATITGNQLSGVITVGTVAGTQCRVTFATAAPVARDCTVTDSTTTIATRATPVDTTNHDFFGTFGAGDQVTFICTVR